MRWRRSPKPLPCREVVELVSDFLEGALPPKMQRRMEHHLRGSDPCVEYVGQIRTTIRIAGDVGPEPVDPHTHQHLVDLYREWQEP
jgi:hypothetical protein